MKTATSV
ncbi:hypothetical protein ECPA25_2610, partial [Escherichia coli PA25]